MKKIFENQEDAVRVLSNAAMKKVLGGNQPEISTDQVECRVICSSPKPVVSVKVPNCMSIPEGVCDGNYTVCECEIIF